MALRGVSGAASRIMPPAAPQTNAARIVAQAASVINGETRLIDASGWSDEQFLQFALDRRK